MLYLFKDANGCLYNQNGDIATQNGVMLQATNHVLVMGDPTSDTGNANKILAKDPKTTSTNKLDLQLIYPTDLAGATTDTEAVAIQRAGLGDIITPNAGGYTTRTGLDAYFWKAPSLSYGVANPLGGNNLTSGITYFVIAGSVVYGGVTYHRGQTFKATTSGDVTSGTGSFMPYFSMVPGADQNRKAWFSIINFCKADMAQPNGNYGTIQEPIEPMVSTTTTSTQFIGWVK